MTTRNVWLSRIPRWLSSCRVLLLSEPEHSYYLTDAAIQRRRNTPAVRIMAKSSLELRVRVCTGGYHLDWKHAATHVTDTSDIAFTTNAIAVSVAVCRLALLLFSAVKGVLAALAQLRIPKQLAHSDLPQKLDLDNTNFYRRVLLSPT